MFDEAEKDIVYETKIANNSKELECLHNLVKELEEREEKLEGELLEYYRLKEQESDIVELQRQLEIKTVEIDMLNITINSLQTERKKLQEEIAKVVSAKKELEVARNMIKELQRQIQFDANQTKGQLLLLKQQTEMVAKVREEVNNMRHANEDLSKQVEGLQKNRFSEVEELVYLRWVNACLRYELRNYHTPAGKTSTRDLSRNLSLKSQERAKPLMLEYAGSERGQRDTDVESNFSQPSSPGSEDFDNASIDSSTSRCSSLSKKPSLIQKLKKWGKSKDDQVLFHHQPDPSRQALQAG